MTSPEAAPGVRILAENKDCNFVTTKSYKPAKNNTQSDVFHVLEDAGHNGVSGVNECSTTQPKIHMDDDIRK